MTEAIQPTITAALLLANREMLSLEKAATYLVGRVRAQTTLGASEFLEMCIFDQEKGRGAFDARVNLALICCNLYREMFPREYAASQSPPFSTAREQEFYLQCERRLFPLGLDQYKSDPRFFLPFIPVSNLQQHDWVKGCCGFENIQLVFQLVLALIRHEGPKGWHYLRSHYGLDKSLALAPMPAAAGWTHFTHACVVGGTPLCFLTLAFKMVCYKTGNPWLDIRPGEAVGFEWGKSNVAKLFLFRREADEINAKVLMLNQWLVEDPVTRITHAIELWNAASKLEAEQGYAGMYVDAMGRLR